jgi:hypothetical protein
VVLHVPGAEVALRAAVLELCEQLVHALVEDVHQHVEAAAVGHADDHLVEPERSAALHDDVDQRDDGLRALEGEALGPGVALVHERLQDLRLGELAEHAQLGVERQRRAVARGFDALLEPATLAGVLHLHQLDADGAAVRLAQRGHDLAQGAMRWAHQVERGHDAIEIRLGEAEAAHRQLARRGRGAAQRIEIGEEVAALAVGGDEVGDLPLQGGRGHHRHRGGHAAQRLGEARRGQGEARAPFGRRQRRRLLPGVGCGGARQRPRRTQALAR